MKLRLSVSTLLIAGLLLGGCASTTGKQGDPQQADSRSMPQERTGGPAAVYTEMAVAYMRENDYITALRNAEKAISVNPQSPDAHNVKALIHQRLGQTEKADKHFRKAVAYAPNDPYIRNAYGSFLCSQEQYAEADKEFEVAVANPLNPTPWVALTNAAICAQGQGNASVAESYLRRALSANPVFAPALLRMASLNVASGNYLGARAYLQRYEAVAAHTPESLWLGIQTERRIGDPDKASSYQVLLEGKFPDSAYVQRLREVNTR